MHGLHKCAIEVETIRVDEFISRDYTFFADPDGLPIALHETHGLRERRLMPAESDGVSRYQHRLPQFL